MAGGLVGTAFPVRFFNDIRVLFAIFVIASCRLISQGELTSNHPDVPDVSYGSCTSFCLHNHGYALFCSNYDNQIKEGILFVNKRHVGKSGLDESTTGEKAQWISKYGSVTFSLIGNQHVWAGMNEKGLVISTMALRGTKVHEPDERPPLSSGYWVQYILDQCKTIEEVIEAKSAIRMGETVDHYLVCDRYGNTAIIEWLDGKIVHHTGHSVPVKCLTNNRYKDLVDGWKRDEKLDFLENEEKGSIYRFRIAADRVSRFRSKNSKKAINYAFRTLEKVAGSYTQWSIVFNTEKLQIHFHTKTHPHVRIVNLMDFDFSCNTPVMLLDIHEKLSGDVTEEFKIYTSDYHIDYLGRALRRWGVDMTPEMVKSLSAFLDSFPCKQD